MKKETKKSGVRQQNQNEYGKDDSQSMLSRRAFLKKSAYSAPVIVVLGTLIKPSDANADNSVPATPPW